MSCRWFESLVRYSYVGLGNKSGAPSFYGMLAELETITGGYDRALMQIDQGLAMADETEEHFTDSYLHRLRGECLLRLLSEPRITTSH